MKFLPLNNESSIYAKVRDLYNAYKVMEKNIPIVEPSSSKPKSSDTDDWMDEYLELESSTNNDLIYISLRHEKRLGMKKDHFNLQY